MKRREFLQSLTAAAALLAMSPHLVAKNQPSFRFLRPPGALDEAEFLRSCIRCGKCGEICPNRTIKFFSTENGVDSIDTPYIVPREQACILCMKCGDVCPTGAIKSVPREMNAILENIEMGTARVDRSLCLSWQGKTCGVCFRACPLPNVAIRIGRLEQPHVLKDCVGCGLCERSCIQIPQAIRIIPSHSLASKNT